MRDQARDTLRQKELVLISITYHILVLAVIEQGINNIDTSFSPAWSLMPNYISLRSHPLNIIEYIRIRNSYIA